MGMKTLEETIEQLEEDNKSHLSGTKACVKCMRIKRQQDELNKANAELQQIIDDLLNQIKRAKIPRLRGGAKPKAKENKISCCESPGFVLKSICQYRKTLLKCDKADSDNIKMMCEKILRKYE